MRTESIDLDAEADRIEQEVAELDRAKQDLVDRLSEEYGTYSNVPSEQRQAFDQIESERIDRQGLADALRRVVDAWGGSVVVLQELSMGQAAKVQDQVAERSLEMDFETGRPEGVPKEGFARVETLREAVVNQPEGAPTRVDPQTGDDVPAPGDYPNRVGEFLYEKTNALTTVGETDLGNSSLREAMQGANEGADGEEATDDPAASTDSAQN